MTRQLPPTLIKVKDHGDGFVEMRRSKLTDYDREILSACLLYTSPSPRDPT